MNTLLDDLFLAGLLQDIGILAFFALLPEDYAAAFSAASSNTDLLETEREVFGVGHDELGSVLLETWELPSYIPTACRNSHNPPAEAQSAIDACVAVSGYIADYFLSSQDQKKIEIATDMAAAYLDLDEYALVEVLESMQSELHPVEELFEITILSPTLLAGIVSEAREMVAVRTMVKLRELEDKVQHDGLTGAHNRAFFNDIFQHEFLLSVQKEMPLSLAMIDIDNYKSFNDTYGHIAGDGVLVAVAQAISDQIRQTDILCRYGGDEFVLVLPGTTLSAARIILSRIRESIAAIVHKPDSTNAIHITASIGLAANMDKEKSFKVQSELLEAADRALYAAKYAGRNRVVEWNPTLTTHPRKNG